jgi:hypothetical protein
MHLQGTSNPQAQGFSEIFLMDNQQNTVFSVAGLILAAGAVARMDQPKLLLPWKGKALIYHPTHTALKAG